MYLETTGEWGWRGPGAAKLYPNCAQPSKRLKENLEFLSSVHLRKHREQR